jgi:molybdate transport system ATP-binding protein
MLYVSHSLSELQYIADQLVVVYAGKITQVAPIHQAIHQLNSRGETSPKTSLSLTIAEHLPDYGLTRLTLPATKSTSKYHNIYLPILEQNNSQRLISQQLPCIIYARDISISNTTPEHSSIVNYLPASISEIKYSKTNALVTLNTNEQPFYAQISLWSAKRMALTTQSRVYIQFKANAVHSYYFTEPTANA